MSPTLRIGTRGSDLALWQARRVSALIADRLGIACTTEIIATQGDTITDVAFSKMEGKGFFTKELQEALLDGRVDLVVHSLKDLPTDAPDGLELVAVPERGAVNDLLVARPGVIGEGELGLHPSAVLGTSSTRRAAQALHAVPGLEVRALRGNVPTRVRKLRDGQYDAILLAAAGVRRLELDLTDLEWRELGTQVMLPAPGQGALAVEVRQDDPTTRPLSCLHDPAVGACVSAERALLDALGGGCHLPLGALATEQDGGCALSAALGSVDDAVSTSRVVRVEAVADTPTSAAEACHRMLKAHGVA